MRIDTGQHLRIDQRMKMAPRMIHSMEILQMTAQALEARIEHELENNPTLEQREPGPDAEELEGQRQQAERDDHEGERELVVTDDTADASHADDFERLSNLSEQYGDSWGANNFETGESFRVSRDNGERDAKLDAMANTASRGMSLTDQLMAQWIMIEATPGVDVAGRYLIDFLDADGYLRTDKKTLIDQAPPGTTVDDLDRAVELIQQTLEPTGLGARDLRECLLIQIDAEARRATKHSDGEDHHGLESGNGHLPLGVERELVSKHLKDVETNRIPRIAKAMGIEIEQVKKAIMNLRRFHPHPGRLLVDEQPHLISPDAVIEYDDDQDRYTARLTHERLPSLQISAAYASMVRDRQVNSQTRKFVGNNLQSARWLIDAIQQRHSTLLRVINVVLEAQRDYFDQGPQHLKPLPMTLVADQLGIHVATVSRAVADKYLQTPRGIVPLRMFFSGGTETGSGDQMSWAAIQAKLEQIIDEEDKQHPLSDDLLVEKLRSEGIDIARRTVAKYRKQLNIPPARQRREY